MRAILAGAMTAIPASAWDQLFLPCRSGYARALPARRCTNLPRCSLEDAAGYYEASCHARRRGGPACHGPGRKRRELCQRRPARTVRRRSVVDAVPRYSGLFARRYFDQGRSCQHGVGARGSRAAIGSSRRGAIVALADALQAAERGRASGSCGRSPTSMYRGNCWNDRRWASAFPSISGCAVRSKSGRAIC